MVLALACCARAAPFREVLRISHSRTVSDRSVSAPRCRPRENGRIAALRRAAGALRAKLRAGSRQCGRAAAAHVADAVPAEAAQRQAVPLEQPRLPAVDGAGGAVGAVVLPPELPAAQLDRAMLARRGAVG